MGPTKSATFRGEPPQEDPPSRKFKINDFYIKRKVKLDSWITDDKPVIPEEPIFKELPLPVQVK